MKRRLFNGLALLSLLLAIAVAGLWVRSVWWASDQIECFKKETRFLSFITSISGYVELRWARIGFAFWARPDDGGISYMQFDARPTEWKPDWSFSNSGGGYYFVRAPYWTLLTLASALPIWWFLRCRRSLRQPGLCHKCGYDLRASKDRCPECGEAIQTGGPENLRDPGAREST